jgi:hypothetical protein
MCLPTPQVDRFYAIWRPLLYFVNERLKLVPSLLGARMDAKLPTQEAAKIREKLWADDALLDEFAAENPASLSEADLALAKSWKNRRSSAFFLFKNLKKHSIFIEETNQPRVYAVKGLYSRFDEIIPPMLPMLVKTVLLPFEDEITYDGLINPYNVSFGSGIRGNLKAIYDDAKEQDVIITSLSPAIQLLSREESAARAEATNTKVLAAFRKHLYQSGLSEKTVERDVQNVAAFASTWLANQSEIHSLREASTQHLHAYLSRLSDTVRRPSITSFKRFYKFLQETGRADWAETDEVLVLLRSL